MHISDQDLVRALDGELAARDADRVDAHLKECWTCRVRKQDLEKAIANFVLLPKADLPPVEGPRALLKARLSYFPEKRVATQNWWLAAGICALLFIELMIGQFWRQSSRMIIVAVPNPRLTPGATVL